MDKLRNYINTFQQAKAESEELNDLFTSQFDDTIMVSTNQEEYNLMPGKIVTKELLTIISLRDNPTLNLDVAQPCKYKIDENGFATGIMCYKKNALELLKKQLQPDEKIIEIKIQVSIENTLNLLSYGSKKYLKAIYNTISEDVKNSIKSDKDFMNYVYQNGKVRIDMIQLMGVLGESIYPGSTIYDYMDYAFVIKNRDIIKSAKEI